MSDLHLTVTPDEFGSQYYQDLTNTEKREVLEENISKTYHNIEYLEIEVRKIWKFNYIFYAILAVGCFLNLAISIYNLFT